MNLFPTFAPQYEIRELIAKIPNFSQCRQLVKRGVYPMDAATIAGLWFGAVGAIPVVSAITVGFSKKRRGRRSIGFGRTCSVDVVLTLSANTPSDHGAPIVRPLTGIGQVTGTAHISRFLARFYLRKNVRIHLSGHINHRIDGDEIILGGPAKNEEAARLLGQLRENFHFREFLYNDEGALSIRIVTDDGRSFDVPKYDTGIINGVAKRDLVLIVCSDSISARGDRRRALLSSGFTSYGTSAGVEYIFEDLATMSRRKIYRALDLKPRMPLQIVLIIEVEFSGISVKRLERKFCCIRSERK
ncbi:hypothetical protein ACIOD2_01790 [Amycolatopsis sp. NPDC088138]|uniref:hypothetical protein n=1 Tax=Amycolatopsis sp. NPDC088138 TaxID=3363938 RepID=UPI003804135E